jgi:uncharacterized protein
MTYINRAIEVELNKWKFDSDRYPLLIRGARQVGKSSLIRNFGKGFDFFIEVNFESDSNASKVFATDLHPQRICEQLSILYNKPIVAGKTLLFFDEIQSCLPAISALRFFYEQIPELHVIAAGSLLEFAIADLPSFGVGRVSSMFLYPFSFNEFLNAGGEKMLQKAISEATPNNPLPEPIHIKALDWYKRFLILGGMPKVVATYFKGGDVLKCQQILDILNNSYNDDFAKYGSRISPSIIRDVFKSVVIQNGNKYVFAKALPHLSLLQTKNAINLLTMAGLLVPVVNTSANGIPLGAEVNLKMQKFLIFDTGIFQRILGLKISEVLLNNSFEAINKGALAELNVGLELIKYASCYQRQQLYYWHREAKSSNAEVDYILQKNTNILPIEVKAGTKGSMQSLNLFMETKKISKGIRISQENFSCYDNIDVYPLYAVANIINS